MSKVTHKTKSKDPVTYIVDHAKIDVDKFGSQAAMGGQEILGAQIKAFFAGSGVEPFEFGVAQRPSPAWRSRGGNLSAAARFMKVKDANKSQKPGTRVENITLCEVYPIAITP